MAEFFAVSQMRPDVCRRFLTASTKCRQQMGRLGQGQMLSS